MYEILASPVFEVEAKRLVTSQPERFRYHPTEWKKFSDGTDHIRLGGFKPKNVIRGANVLLLASFHNSDAVLQMYSAMVVLAQSGIESLTVMLPFYPAATMERVLEEGVIATANTMAQLFNGLPSPGKPIRLIMYDLHTLGNRFYFNQSCVASLNTAIPLLKAKLDAKDCICFPDEGAAKRFTRLFTTGKGQWTDFVTCAKKRIGEFGRHVIIQDGDPKGKNVIIVDDLVRTGSTLYQCAQVLLKEGAKSVSVFCTHAVFPDASWKHFLKGSDQKGKFACFRKIYVTNSCPHITKELPKDNVFEVLDLTPLWLKDLL